MCHEPKRAKINFLALRAVSFGLALVYRAKVCKAVYYYYYYYYYYICISFSFVFGPVTITFLLLHETRQRKICEIFLKYTHLQFAIYSLAVQYYYTVRVLTCCILRFLDFMDFCYFFYVYIYTCIAYYILEIRL